MGQFSPTSQSKLATCHPDLIKLFNEVVKHFDCVVLEGHRGQKDQDEAYATGRSKLKYPNGNHNAVPSNAVDVSPYPVDWKDRERMSLFAGFVKGAASQMNINIRWGGDWNSDTQVKDNSFDDLPHFELHK